MIGAQEGPLRGYQAFLFGLLGNMGGAWDPAGSGVSSRLRQPGLAIFCAVLPRTSSLFLLDLGQLQEGSCQARSLAYSPGMDSALLNSAPEAALYCKVSTTR